MFSFYLKDEYKYAVPLQRNILCYISQDWLVPLQRIILWYIPQHWLVPLQRMTMCCIPQDWLVPLQRITLCYIPQDWLREQFMGMPSLLHNLTLGDQWLTQMAQAADDAGVHIQYCMSLSRHAMQALLYPAVTQV